MGHIHLMVRVNVMEKRASLLRRTDKYIEAGTRLSPGETETLKFGEKMVEALPIDWKGKTYYILKEDLSSLESRNIP